MKNFLALVIFFTVSGCSGPSDEELKIASDSCVDFYKEKRADYGDIVESNDHWMKNGKLVIALKVKERGLRGQVLQYSKAIRLIETKRAVGTISVA